MGWTFRALNLDYEIEEVEVIGESILYDSQIGPPRYYKALIWVMSTRRWFADEQGEGYDFQCREITAEVAEEWWLANVPDRPVPPELRSDLRAAQGQITAVPPGAVSRINLTPARRRILGILEASKKRMTKSQILGLMIKMSKAGQLPSEPTVRIELTKMVKAKWLDNDPKARPRGYGITDLGRSILEGADG
jgi:hypothetical protein